MKMIFNDRQTDSADPQTLKITILVYGTLKDFHLKYYIFIQFLTALKWLLKGLF